MEETHAAAEKFCLHTRALIPNYDKDFVLNTDQTGCQYQSTYNRTLAEQGSKVVLVKRKDMNKVTHSYTAQYVMTLSGKLLPKVFICLQEQMETLDRGCKNQSTIQWQCGFDQQNAFQTLKNCLTTPPVLKQADGTQPYIIRTDASNYALGAVLLQGEGSDEHPIEYASRLLTPVERNYSTTEREALAVVWTLKKFRGYIEGMEITVASDHQPLKWLLNLKSPTGRLA
ncbi:retrovirus-related Pol polyprotein from transposon 297 [Trichonephila clavipes]|nr:retrovirus-related Pol polyprotein from transposon 297 [Trichonephila clavipes]